MNFFVKITSVLAVMASVTVATANDQCITSVDHRPQSRAPTGKNKNRRFNLVESDAKCVGANGREYEWGAFDDVETADDCADLCVTNVDSQELTDEIRGMNMDCGKKVCQCLYDEGIINHAIKVKADRPLPFDDSNHTSRVRKGSGSVAHTQPSTGVFCYSRAGYEEELVAFE